MVTGFLNYLSILNSGYIGYGKKKIYQNLLASWLTLVEEPLPFRIRRWMLRPQLVASCRAASASADTMEIEVQIDFRNAAHVSVTIGWRKGRHPSITPMEKEA